MELTERLDYIELSMLAGKHRPVEPGPCRVCGAELEIGSMGGGKATEYACGSPEADIIRNGKWGSPGERAATEHRQASKVSIRYHGDSRVGALIEEVRQTRREKGEEVDVPVGYSVIEAYRLLPEGADEDEDDESHYAWVEWTPPEAGSDYTFRRTVYWTHEGNDEWVTAFWDADRD